MNTGYYIYNAHGDVVQLPHEEGEIVKEYSYDAFGVEKEMDEADENPFRYCGEYYDKETGTIYLRARYYAPSTGRFLSEDPIRDGLNWYTYANGNPIFFIDPLGLAIEKLTDWLGSFKDYYSSVNWDANTKTATVYLKKGSQSLIIGGDRGITVYYTVGIEGTYIGIDGKMYVETGNKNSSSKMLWNYIDPSLEYDPVKDTVILATAIVAIAKGSEAIIDRVSHAYDAVKGAGDKAATSPNVPLKIDLEFFGNKSDIKMVNDAANKIGVDRILFGEYIHEVKAELGMRANQNFTFQELVELARELKNTLGK